MSRIPGRVWLSVALAASLTSCAEPPVAPYSEMEPDDWEAPAADLDLSLPDLTGWKEDPIDGVVGADASELPPEWEGVAPRILSATSQAGAEANLKYVEATTTYVGANAYSMDVFLNVSFHGRTLVHNFMQRTGARTMLPPNPFTTQRRFGFSTAYLDGTCGFRVWGNAQHQVDLDYGPIDWSSETERSSARPAQQPDCVEEIVGESQPEGGGGGSGGGGGFDESIQEPVTCWYRVWWNRSTGRIIRVEFLWCR